MLGGIGIPELLIVLVIVLVIFGAGKLPMIGGNIGKAIKNFKSGVKEEKVDAAEPNEQIEDQKAEEKTKV